MKVYVQLDKKVKKRPQRPPQHATPLQIIQPQWKHRRRRWKIHHMLKRAKFRSRLISPTSCGAHRRRLDLHRAAGVHPAGRRRRGKASRRAVRRSGSPAPKTRAFLRYHVMSPGVATLDWWAVRGVLRGERDEATVCERTFQKLRADGAS